MPTDVLAVSLFRNGGTEFLKNDTAVDQQCYFELIPCLHKFKRDAAKTRGLINGQPGWMVDGLNGNTI